MSDTGLHRKWLQESVSGLASVLASVLLSELELVSGLAWVSDLVSVSLSDLVSVSVLRLVMVKVIPGASCPFSLCLCLFLCLCHHPCLCPFHVHRCCHLWPRHCLHFHQLRPWLPYAESSCISGTPASSLICSTCRTPFYLVGPVAPCFAGLQPMIQVGHQIKSSSYYGFY